MNGVARTRLSALLAACLGAGGALAGDPASRSASAFPALPLPPVIDALIGLPRPMPVARGHYLALVLREADRRGLPGDVADAVAAVESGYHPGAVGKVGELGLMQVRPATAAMLGFKGPAADLADPETNLRYGVAYLAQAWRLTGGDLCRTLMKYRAGHGEERMSPLSVEYCRRARLHLAEIGSPLAGAPLAVATWTPAAGAAGTPPAGVAAMLPGTSRFGAVPPRSVGPAVSSRSNVPVPPIRTAVALRRGTPATGAAGLAMRSKPRTAEDSRRFWAAHEARIKAITDKLKASRLRIAAGV